MTVETRQYVFGTGNLYAMPTGGGAPLKFGAIQDVSVDISADIKQLYGQYQFPLAIARGKAKIEGKASTGEINVNTYNSIYFQQDITADSVETPVFAEAMTVPTTESSVAPTGVVQVAGIATATFAAPHGFTEDQLITVTGMTPTGYNVAGVPVLSVPTPTTLTYAVPSGTASPATVMGDFSGSLTAQVANSGAAFVMDLGVSYESTGLPLEQVASGPTQGQYSVSGTGDYTFAAADEGVGVFIDYIYSGTTGQTLAINNVLMGQAPTFQLVLAEEFEGNTFVLGLYSCTSNKLSFPFKMDDFTINEVDFQAQANSAGKVGYISTSGV